jgi:hypothetical protein
MDKNQLKEVRGMEEIVKLLDGNLEYVNQGVNGVTGDRIAII